MSQPPPWQGDLDRFNEAWADVEKERGMPGHVRSYERYIYGFVAAAVKLTLSGLDAYIKTAEKDRESAQKDRRVMTFLTWVIGLSALGTFVATGLIAYYTRHPPASLPSVFSR